MNISLKKITLIALFLLLAGGNLFVHAKALQYSSQSLVVEKKISMVKGDNNILEEQLLQAGSFQELTSLAADLGFTTPASARVLHWQETLATINR